MFTGIIKAKAAIKKTEGKDGSLFLTIATPKGWRIKSGDSIATDGVCLTVKKVNKNDYIAELMPETLKRSYFSKVIPKELNLEQPLRLSDRIDGHLVSGHIDAVGKIQTSKTVGRAKIYKISFPKKFRKLVAEKGSVAVDGISLTVVATSGNWFIVSLVDYTLNHTTLGQKQPGDLVNLEFDMIAKYLRPLTLQK